MKLLNGHILDRLPEIEDCSIDTIVTSPPYWQLRRYAIPDQIWGGSEDCEHDWEESRYYLESGAIPSARKRFIEGGEENAQLRKETRWQTSATCTKCGAWRGQLGLERYPEQYVQHLSLIFPHLHRILKPTGLLFLNIGDTFHARSLCAIPQQLQIELLRQGWGLRGVVTLPRFRKQEDRTPLDEVLIIASKGTKRQRHYWNKDNEWANRSLWQMPRTSDRRGHNASFHSWLPRQCIDIGCPAGGTVLDPFAGSGTVLEVAEAMGRQAIGVELGEFEAVVDLQKTIFDLEAV